MGLQSLDDIQLIVGKERERKGERFAFGPRLAASIKSNQILDDIGRAKILIQKHFGRLLIKYPFTPAESSLH